MDQRFNPCCNPTLSSLRATWRMKASENMRCLNLISGFFKRIKVCANHNGCWIWKPNAKHVDLYGRFIFNGKNYSTHRLSYALFVGPLEAGQDICHHCDTPACVNPTHLFQASRSANMEDRSKKIDTGDYSKIKDRRDIANVGVGQDWSELRRSTGS